MPLEVNNATVFYDPSSPQYEAAEWLWFEDRESYWQEEGLAQDRPKVIQRYAVATLYYATDGKNWQYCGKESVSNCFDQDWMVPVDECIWFGVTCNANGQVEMLNFRVNQGGGNELYGTLPRELSLLTELKRFVAPNNALLGNLDDPFHGLSLLDTIVISKNRLNGTIPGAVLERNSGLGVFDVGWNSMTGTLPDILISGKLSHLQIHENRLSGTIPANIGNATRLQILDLQGNNLIGSIPDSLYDLPILGIFTVNNNTNFGGIVDTRIGHLTSLSRFEAGSTSIGGTIPDELYQLTLLRTLILSNSSMSGPLKEDLHKLHATLMQLKLNANGFSGPLPTALDVMTGLQQLLLDDNSFTGTISDVVCVERGFGRFELFQLEADCNIECNCNDRCK